jgi:hypothetical protein
MRGVEILVESILVNLLGRKIALVYVFHYLLRSVNDLCSSRVRNRQV